MASLLPHAVPLAAALLPCIYVTLWAAGRTPPEAPCSSTRACRRAARRPASGPGTQAPGRGASRTTPAAAALAAAHALHPSDTPLLQGSGCPHPCLSAPLRPPRRHAGGFMRPGPTGPRCPATSHSSLTQGVPCDEKHLRAHRPATCSTTPIGTAPTGPACGTARLTTYP